MEARVLRLTKRNISTIEEVASIALESIPMTLSTADLSPGRKAFFPIPMKKSPKHMVDFIYIFAESRLISAPRNKGTGFTEEDVTDDSGIYVFKKDGSCVNGCSYPIDTFLQNITNDSLKNRFLYKLNEMKAMVHLDESFLEAASMDWASGKSDSVNFGFKRLH